MNTSTNSIVEVSEHLALDHNPAAVFLASKVPSTRYQYATDLKEIATLLGAPDPLYCNWAALRFQHTQAIRAMLCDVISERTGRHLAAHTINRVLSVLRGVLKVAWRLGQIDTDDYTRAIDIEPVVGETLPAGRELNRKEIIGLMSVCADDLTMVGIRDTAIIALMYTCGLRRSEVTGLDLADYYPTEDRLLVHGKRRKDRTAYLVGGAAQAMADWLIVRGDQPGALFWPIRYGRLYPKPMVAQTIYDMLARRAVQAGIANFTPHDLRRTFVGDLLEAGADISTVSKMAGHSSVITTAKYDRRSEATKRKAAELLSVPYRSRESVSK